AGACARCGRARQFDFALPPALPAGGFGGPDPSTIIDPGELLLVSDAAARRVPAEPARLGDEERSAGRRQLERAIAALEEVLKFVPADASSVPTSAFTSDVGAQLSDREPGRFTRACLQARS